MTKSSCKESGDRVQWGVRRRACAALCGLDCRLPGPMAAGTDTKSPLQAGAAGPLFGKEGEHRLILRRSTGCFRDFLSCHAEMPRRALPPLAFCFHEIGRDQGAMAVAGRRRNDARQEERRKRRRQETAIRTGNGLDEQPEKPAGAQVPPIRTKQEDVQMDKQRLLIVEDDKSIALGLEYSLGQEGFEVTVCGDVRAALEALKGTRFSLAVLDLSLPDGSGYDICRAAKQQGDLPVIFLTARDDEGSVVMGLDMGADDYITKPFRLRELVSRIRSVLRRTGRGGTGVYEYGNVQINTAQGKVFKNGQDVFLTALEYRLLMTLLSHPGQILSRGQLLESIWDVSGDFVNDNTLTVYIKRLREKIEDDPQNPVIIQTVRGLGYRMEPPAGG